jgi:hypothetical protein
VASYGGRTGAEGSFLPATLPVSVHRSYRTQALVQERNSDGARFVHYKQMR